MKTPNGSHSKKIRVLVLDDHPLLRAGVTRMLEARDQYDCRGAVDCILQAKVLLAEGDVDLVILGLRLKGGCAMEFIRWLNAEKPGIGILVFSELDELVYAERVFSAGALGYITKWQPADELLTAVRMVLSGKLYSSESVLAQTLRKFFRDTRGFVPKGLEDLSAREQQVFQFVGAGASAREVAVDLGLSVKTIETYLEKIKLKLGLTNSSELKRRARQWANEFAAGLSPAILFPSSSCLRRKVRTDGRGSPAALCCQVPAKGTRG